MPAQTVAAHEISGAKAGSTTITNEVLSESPDGFPAGLGNYMGGGPSGMVMVRQHVTIPLLFVGQNKISEP